MSSRAGEDRVLKREWRVSAKHVYDSFVHIRKYSFVYIIKYSFVVYSSVYFYPPKSIQLCILFLPKVYSSVYLGIQLCIL